MDKLSAFPACLASHSMLQTHLHSCSDGDSKSHLCFSSSGFSFQSSDIHVPCWKKKKKKTFHEVILKGCWKKPWLDSPWSKSPKCPHSDTVRILAGDGELDSLPWQCSHTTISLLHLGTEELRTPMPLHGLWVPLPAPLARGGSTMHEQEAWKLTGELGCETTSILKVIQSNWVLDTLSSSVHDFSFVASILFVCLFSYLQKFCKLNIKGLVICSALKGLSASVRSVSLHPPLRLGTGMEKRERRQLWQPWEHSTSLSLMRWKARAGWQSQAVLISLEAGKRFPDDKFWGMWPMIPSLLKVLQTWVCIAGLRDASSSGAFVLWLFPWSFFPEGDVNQSALSKLLYCTW